MIFCKINIWYNSLRDTQIYSYVICVLLCKLRTEKWNVKFYQREDTTMDANMKKRNELLAKTVIKGLESRNMSGYYAQDREAALKQALELIPNGSTIAMGGCMSAHEIGLVKALQDGEYNYIDRAKLEPREGLMAAYDADFFLSSANAVTDDGVSLHSSWGEFYYREYLRKSFQNCP